MIRLFALSIALAAPAAAQVSPITFDAGKLLPLASGQWSYIASATGSEARYDGYLAIRCDRATRTVTVMRPGAAPAGKQVLGIRCAAVDDLVQGCEIDRLVVAEAVLSAARRKAGARQVQHVPGNLA